METIVNYLSPLNAIDELKAKGYHIDYNLDEEFETLTENANQYVIDFMYRYEGMTDPADESTIYGIRHENGENKGMFVAGNLSFIEGKKRDIIVNLEMKSKSQEH